MFALVNRIRVFASSSVLEAVEAFVKKLVERYGEKHMSIEQIKSGALEQHADPMNDFALSADLNSAGCMCGLPGVVSSARSQSNASPLQILLSKSTRASPSTGLRKKPTAPLSK
jgi:hypothetical protein